MLLLDIEMKMLLTPPRSEVRSDLAALREVLRNPSGFLLTLSQVAGDIAQFSAGPVRIVSINGADLAQQVLVDQADAFRKMPAVRVIGALTGNGLLINEDATWRRHRRLAAPAFQHRRIAAYADTIAALATETVGAWRDGDVLDIGQAMKALSLRIIGLTLFDTDFAHDALELSEDIEVALDFINRQFGRISLPLLDRLTPGKARGLDAIAKVLRDVFQDISFNSNKLGDEQQKYDILRHLLEDFAKPALNLRPSRVGTLDVIGNAYEFLIKNFASTSGKKAGEFYTPPEVSTLMARLMAPQEGDEICDPTCGSGSLLMKCGRLVRESTGSRKYALYGQEAIGSTWALAKMNMILHGEDNHRIEWGDTIRNPKLLDGTASLKLFDIVVANPPFSLEKWGFEGADADKFSRFRRAVPPRTKGDYAFILHMIETMKPGTGRMAVVVPHGVLFRGAAEGRIRQKLIEENLLDVVIGLPEKLFYGTGIPAAVLVFRKNKTDEKVLFIDASRDFEPGKNQNLLREIDLQRIVDTVRARHGVTKYAYLATQAEIAENEINLNIPRYVDTFEDEAEIDLMAVRREREQLKAELDSLEVQMAGYLKELGYE